MARRPVVTPGRRSAGIYWRRRIAALAALAVALLAVVLVVRSLAGGDDGGSNGAGGSADSGDEEAAEKPTVRFTVAASGDLLIHSPVFYRALEYGGGARYDFRPMLTDVRRIVQQADLGICHLEVPLTAGTPTGFPAFQAPASLADAIKWTGWDACSTASNHSQDAGPDGVPFTLRQLDRRQIKHSGTNMSAQAPRAAVMRAKGVEVAFLAYVSNEVPGIPPPPNDWTLNFAEAERILADAKAARRAGADAVIVSLHWGIEYQAAPSEIQLQLARRLTKSPDVTALIGQHVHVVQPIRRINGKPVVFGEGNLLSNQTAACCPAESQDGLVALLEFRSGPGGTRVERVRYIPTWVQQPEYRVVRAPPESYQRTVATVGQRPGIAPVGEGG
jgi:poly-gamma-glutamate capsule biosynthesis protein CapA/YwtB (metallophosphatase superfamily)